MNEMHAHLDEPMNQLKDLMNHLFIDDIKDISDRMSKQVANKVESTISEFNRDIEDRIEKAVEEKVGERLDRLDKVILYTRDKLSSLSDSTYENQDKNKNTFEQLGNKLTELQATQESSKAMYVERHADLERLIEVLTETIKENSKTSRQENQRVFNSIKESSNELIKAIENQNTDLLVKSKEFFGSTKETMVSWNSDFIARMVEFKNAVEQKFKTFADKSLESISSISASIPQENSKIVGEVKSELELKFVDIEKVVVSQRKINIYLIALLFISIINSGLILMMLIL